MPLYLHPGVPLPVVQKAYYAGFDPDVSARAFLENAPISQSDKEKIAHGNAEKLFNL